MSRAVLFTLVLCGLAGCAPEIAAPAPGTPSFDETAAAYINREGAGVIRGQVFWKQTNGAAMEAVGEMVRLIPATPYAQARFAQLYGSQKFLRMAGIRKIEADPRYTTMTRTTTTGTTGHFAFDHVAPGRYYLASQVTWRKKNEFLSNGGSVYDEVVLSGTESGPVRAILAGH